MSARKLTALGLLAAMHEPEIRQQIASEWLAAVMFIVAVLALYFVVAMMQ